MTMTAAPAARKSTYAPLELFDTDRLLDADERDIAATVRKFVDTRLKPNVEEWFESATLPRELAKEFGALGVLGMHLDGLRLRRHQRRQRTAWPAWSSRPATAGFRSFVSVQGSLSMFSIYRYGSEEQKQRVAAATGRRRRDRLLRPDRARLRLQPRRDAYPRTPRRRATGSSTAPRCGSPTATSPTSPSSGRRPTTASADSSCPLTHRASRPTRSTASCRCAPRSPPSWCSTTSDCPHRRSCRDAVGLSAPLSCLNEARFGIVFGALGAARDCLETAIAYARQREVFDKPLAGFQLTQDKLANMTVELRQGHAAGGAPRPDQGRRRRAARAGQPGQAQQRPRGPRDRPRVPDTVGRQRNHPGVLTRCATRTTWSPC